MTSIFHNLSLRFAGVSFQSSVNHPAICSKSRLSRRSLKTHSSNPYLSSKTVWPVNLCEAPFLPEFPIRNGIDESSFKVSKNNLLSIHSIHLLCLCFKVLEIISSGGYGKVFKVMKKDDGGTFAMKVISKSQVYYFFEFTK